MKTETEFKKIVHHDTQGVDVTTDYYDDKVKFIMLRVKTGNSLAVLTPGEAQAAIELLTHALKELHEDSNNS